VLEKVKSLSRIEMYTRVYIFVRGHIDLCVRQSDLYGSLEETLTLGVEPEPEIGVVGLFAVLRISKRYCRLENEILKL